MKFSLAFWFVWTIPAELIQNVGMPKKKTWIECWSLICKFGKMAQSVCVWLFSFVLPLPDGYWQEIFVFSDN